MTPCTKSHSYLLSINFRSILNKNLIELQERRSPMSTPSKAKISPLFSGTKTVFIIDGSSFLYRAFYAIRPMQTPQGVPVQAVYGFCRMVKKLIDTAQPTHLAIAWDSKGATARHELFPEYKAHRQEPPRELFQQKTLIQEFAQLLNILQLEQPGIEADDLIYSYALNVQKEGFSVVIVTSDKDFAQIVSPGVLLYDSFKDEIIDPEAVVTKYGFGPEKVPFYFALVGDSSDNIPGVKGIGPKGATDLVQQFSSLHDLYENLAAVPSIGTRAKLEASKENAFLSEQLFILRYYDLEFSAETAAFSPESWSNARPLFEELSFSSLLKELPTKTTVPLSQRYGYQFITVTTEEQLNNLCHQLRTVGACALDTETDSVDAHQAKLVGISLCCAQGTAFYIPIGHSSGQQISAAVVRAALQPLLSDSTIPKYLHNAKFDQIVLANFGLHITGIAFDTMLAANLLRPDGQRINLKFLSQAYLQEEIATYEQVVTAERGKHPDKKINSFADVSLESATEYAATDAHQTWRLVPLLEKELEKQEQSTLFTTIELPLSQTLYEMEQEGIILDTQLIEQVRKKVVKELDLLREQIVGFAGPDYAQINLNAPRQIEELLFVHLGLQPTKKTSKKTGFSTDQEVLAELAKQHPVPGLLLKYRELSKLLTTYLEALPQTVNPRTQRIHTTFSQISTATGRLASSDPNLQNIPTDGQGIRAAFQAPFGEQFISADYSQIELRVLAFFSQDPTLLAAFLANEDIHAHTAAGLFEVPLAEVTHAQRQFGKRINFSILYGLTPYGLSKDLGISYQQAATYIEKYFAQYPQVATWMDQVIEETKATGYVTTYWGRRRYIPGIYEKNKTLYDAAVRVAINTKAQGTAAEIMKLGMLRLHEHFSLEKNNARIVLQIHDELLVTTPEKTVAAVAADMVRLLQTVVTWNVPLLVTTRIGKTWEDVTK